MVIENVMEDYRIKTKAELKKSAMFAKDAQRELRKGNFKVALAQVLEAERHIEDTKVLLKEMDHLNEMERANLGVKRTIRFSQEINEKDRQLQELEKQLGEVKEAAKRETKPEMKEEEEEYKIKV